MVVCKFGGSSLAKKEGIESTVKILKDESRRVAVFSAVGSRGGDEKLTDLLINAYSCAKKGVNCNFLHDKIRQKLLGLPLSASLKNKIEGELDWLFSSLNEVSYDYFVSRGEQLTARIMASITGFEFIDSASTIVYKYNGELDEQSTRTNLKNALTRHGKIALPGFYGGYPNGNVRLLSRGGSDEIGAIVAASLNADLYENWTDVDGIYSANPSHVSSAEVLPHACYQDVLFFSSLGARVIHPNAVLYAKKAGIPIKVRNTFNCKWQGTLIDDVAEQVPFRPCIAVREGYVLIEVTLSGSRNAFRCAYELSNHLLSRQICPEAFIFCDRLVRIIVMRGQDFKQLIVAINSFDAVEWTTQKDVSLVSVCLKTCDKGHFLHFQQQFTAKSCAETDFLTSYTQGDNTALVFISPCGGEAAAASFLYELFNCF